MSLFARKLTLDSFRNFEAFTVDLDEGLTILVGHNAVGKTNCIEALQLLTSGTSFKNAGTQELLHEGSDKGAAHLVMSGDKRKMETGLEVTPDKKTFRLNGKNTVVKNIRGLLPSILFYPDDLRLIKDSPQYRRGEVDSFGCQLNENYHPLKQAFEKALAQRNRLLKDDWVDEDLLLAWTESFIANSALLYLYRTSLFDRLVPKMQENYRLLSQGEELSVSYLPSWGERAKREDKQVVIDTLRDAFERRFADERARRMTLVGPHRDDLRFSIDGKDARIFGSQGQQRSVVLSWKIAEVQLVKEILGYYPLFLLDDVMSELDEDRRQAMLSFIDGGVQTVITTTNLSYFSPDVLQNAKVVNVNG